VVAPGAEVPGFLAARSIKIRKEKRMKMARCFVVFCLMFVSITVLTRGQDAGQSERELTVEQSYLLDSVEMMIVREQSHTDSREQKMIALEYIGEMIGQGKSSEEVRATLEYLSLEGTLYQARENGRLVNNYPDVRTKAATYLGELGTREAKDALIKIVLADPEPMVLTEAIKSLAKIGINENEETINTIAWIVTRYDVLNPDNLLALSAIDAFEKIAEKNGGIKDPSVIRVLMRIIDGRYNPPVRDRAKQVLAQITGHPVPRK
jgi:HEAT repeat protein